MAVTQPRRTKTNPDGACRECRTERAILKSGKTNIRPGGQKDAKLVIGYQNLFGNFFFFAVFLKFWTSCSFTKKSQVLNVWLNFVTLTQKESFTGDSKWNWIGLAVVVFDIPVLYWSLKSTGPPWSLFSLLFSRRRYKSIKRRTSRLKKQLLPWAIRPSINSADPCATCTLGGKCNN